MIAEDKAPSMIIADGDTVQVVTPMTVCIMESLLKTHFLNKAIKGEAKTHSIKRGTDNVASFLR